MAYRTGLMFVRSSVIVIRDRETLNLRDAQSCSATVAQLVVPAGGTSEILRPIVFNLI